MFGKRKLARGNAIVPALVGLAVLMLLAVLFGPSGSNAAEEYYNISGIYGVVEKGTYEGPLNPGNFITPGDLIKITARNHSDGSIEDRVVTDIIVYDEADTEMYRVTWVLNYTGDGDKFSGFITMEKDMISNFQYVSTGNVGIKLNVSDGYNITLNKHISPFNMFNHFHVDTAGPEFEITNPVDDVVMADGVYYAKADTELQLKLTDTDVLANDTWFMTEPNTNYTLNGKTLTNWTGGNITLPSVKGSYILSINSTDRFGHYTVLSWEYVISEFMWSTFYVIDSKTYSNDHVVIDKLYILDNGKVTFDNSTLVFSGTFPTIDVLSRGELVIKGPTTNSGSNIVSTGNQYRIVTWKGSKMTINNTRIDASMNTDFPSTFDLKKGNISMCSITGLNEKMRISGAGVTIEKSTIDIAYTSGGIKIDMNHTWESSPAILRDLVINGTSDVPLEIDETSIYTPYDGGDLYYADDSNSTFEFRFDKTGISEPLVKMPFFVDSRSTGAKFELSYHDGSDWTSLNSISISDITMDEWMNGYDAVFNLSAGPDVTNYRISWLTDDPGLGCAYILHPMYMSNGTYIQPIKNQWTPVTSDVLQIDNVSIIQAKLNFVSVLSSGRIDFNNLTLDGNTSLDYPSIGLIRSRNSGFTLRNTSVDANPGLLNILNARFDSMDDWPTIVLENDEFRAFSPDSEYTIDTAIYIQRGWLDIRGLDIYNATVGISVDRALINIDGTTIQAEDWPINIELPFEYPEDVTIELGDVEIEHYSEDGIIIMGDNIDYNLDIDIKDMLIDSNNNTKQARIDGNGAVSVRVTGDTKGDLAISGIVDGGHGHLIAVNNWPIFGNVKIHDSTLSNAGIDGIYYMAECDLSIKNVVIENGPGYGIYAVDATTIDMRALDISAFRGGGLKLGNNSYLTADELTIDNSTFGFGLDTGFNSYVDIKGSTMEMNFNGIIVNEGTRIEIDHCTIEDNLNYGIISNDADINFLNPNTGASQIAGNGMGGLFIEGGTLDMYGVVIENNLGDGVRLWNVEIIEYNRVTTDSNYGNGLSVFISDAGLLGESPYCYLENSTSRGNGAHGIVFAYDPTSITDQVDLMMYEAILNSNGGFDFTAPEIFHSEWEIRSGIIGSEDASGKMRANGDFIVTGLSGEFINMNITLLGVNNHFGIQEGALLTFENCFISTERGDRSFDIDVDARATIEIRGCYMDNLGTLYASDSEIVEIKSTLIRDSPNGIHIKNSRILMEDSRLEGIPGKALLIESSEVDITGSSFHDNSYGIWVNGLSEDLDISGSSFTQNNWGIYLFDSSDKDDSTDHDVSIVDSTFGNNGLSSIWAVHSNVTLLDTSIDLDSINVKGEDYSANVMYTLDVMVMNEDGDPVDFTMTIDQGLTSSSYDSKAAGEDAYSEVLTGYIVTYEDVLETGYSSITLDMTYSDGSGTRSFILNKPTSIVFNGPIAPWTVTGIFKDYLYGEEDIGLKDGYIDIDGWFTDNEADIDKLVYTVNQVDPEITPHIDGTLIWVTLEKDWNGVGNFSITVTDPHGMSTTVEVYLSVGKQQDPPVASNPRIVVYKSSPPREIVYTGESIEATWDWSDVDGDSESYIKNIEWYLNGKYAVEYEDQVVIANVQAGQIWEFTYYPADSEISVGEPVSSPPIVIQNIAPTLEGVVITSLDPSTETDLIASPIDPDDTESEVLIFHYMWEKKMGENDLGNPIFSNIGASDSPMLHHTFTRKYDTIRVSAWVSDGYSNSDVRTDTVYIGNTPPSIISAKLTPERIDEKTKVIRVNDVIWTDPDEGDSVYLVYRWTVNGVPINTLDEAAELDRSQGGWEYPLRMNITVQIRPFDAPDNDEGESYYLTGYIEPIDTDGDGLFDDANGDGENNYGDDPDDDNDGYYDNIEMHEDIDTDPKDPNSKPRDTDGDGKPDGNEGNTAGTDIMDFDDDNDGLLDEADSSPKNPNLPGDLDKDGVGDDVDPDIDGDGVRNERDWYPRDPFRSSKPKESVDITALDWLSFLLIFIIFAGIVAVIVLIYTGKIQLPSSAPPTVEETAHEAIIEEEGSSPKPKAAKDLEDIEEEELENMSVCSECGELVSLDDPQCPNCGADFDEMEEYDEE